MDISELWKNTLAALEVEISKPNFVTFLSKTQLASLDKEKEEAVITCPSSLVAERLKKRYTNAIKNALLDLTGRNYHLCFKVERRSPPPEKETDLGPLFTRPRSHDGLFPSYTFENFVVGLSNRLAHAAASAVATKPGTLHNPLLFYAGVGLGKTHLMHAIGNAVKENDSKTKVYYCPAENFTNEMIEAIQSRQAAAQFRRKFRTVDLLLVDDIQFLAGREVTQEEFFNTFNELYLSGKQIVLSSDRHPLEIKELEARLVSRFSGGMIADIQPPDLDLRVAILKQKAKERGATLNEEILLTLAEQVAGSIRQLEGTLTQLLLLTQTYAEKSPQELISLLVQEDHLLRQQEPPSPETILTKTCQQFKITKEELTGGKRLREVVLPRQVAMYLLREVASLPLTKIGKFLGGRDHTTVLHGIKAIKERIEDDPLLQKRVETIKATAQSCGENKLLCGSSAPTLA